MSAPGTSRASTPRSKSRASRSAALGVGAAAAFVTESIWENQRGTGLLGRPRFSARSLLPTDRRPWSDSDGNFSLPRDAIQLPADGQWEWTGDWMVDMNPLPGVAECDPDGWIYSFNFVGFPWSPTCSLTTYVRRRKWVRRRRRKNAGNTSGASGGVAAAVKSHSRHSSMAGSPPQSPSANLPRTFPDVLRRPVPRPDNRTLRHPPRTDRERLETLAKVLQLPIIRPALPSSSTVASITDTAGAAGATSTPMEPVPSVSAPLTREGPHGSLASMRADSELAILFGPPPPDHGELVLDDNGAGGEDDLVDENDRPSIAEVLGAMDQDRVEALKYGLEALEFEVSKVHAITLLMQAYPADRKWIATQGATCLMFAGHRERILQAVRLQTSASASSSTTDVHAVGQRGSAEVDMGLNVEGTLFTGELTDALAP
ncbi:hypothetical protein BCR44DRAFT_69202 [Catenaria anguillulae PL171]|uniref:Peroxin/Ferlin domain-containing protein n=1 Tax=Catenaria anguillulae PL171 TaxID=765915 RepID=A0A1Y2H9S3_9FUNG|nr:hypothetical protein BCR44DRAFT_69202 [Catenaria anguillulae PL171]